MNKKAIGVFLVLFMICLLAVPLSAYASYAGDHPLVNVLHDTDTGDLIFTIGDSAYYSQLTPGGTYTVHYTISGIPDGATVTLARLYYYYSWTPSVAQASMTLNGQSLTQLNSYSDRPEAGSYDFYSGTISFDATNVISGNGAYTAVMTNTGTNNVCPYGIGLLIVYHDPNGQPFEYWVNEGAEMLWASSTYGTAPSVTTTTYFPGAIDTARVSGAELITVVPAGDKGANALSFNGTCWNGIYVSNIGVDVRDVSSYLLPSNNTCSITDTGDYMVPSNAFLVVHYSSSDATLSGLSLSSGALSPAFDSGTTSYTASVDNSVSSITVTPTASDANATIKVNGVTVASGSPSTPISLNVGDNSVSVVVYAQDGTTQTYTIVVTRAAPAAPVVTGVSPNSGPYSSSTTVTITGSGFTGATAVYFGTKAAASFTVNSDTSITAASPTVAAGGVTVDVIVYGPGGTSATSSADQFTYLAPPGYKGMNTGASVLTTALHRKDTGDLIFTMGDSKYNPTGQIAPDGTATVNYSVYGIPAGATVTTARLYAYYAYSDSGNPAQASMTLNGDPVTQLKSYSDTKGFGSYNYPCGMISYDATSKISGNGAYTAVLTNTAASGKIQSFYGIGLLIIYHDPNGQPFEYWINEGADLLYPAAGVTPEEATTTTDFTGTIDTSKVSAANLITVVPGGRYGNNSLTFNGNNWTGVYKGGTTCQLAVDSRDVASLLQSSGNSLAIQSYGGSGGTDYMFPTNAILAVYQAVPVTGVSLDKSSATLTVGDTLQLTATVAPDNATNKSVTWSSSNTAVATVDANGLVTAVAAGNATITVTTADGGYTATCAVTVPATPTTADPTVPVSTTPLQVIVPSGVTNAALKTTPAVSGGNATVTLPQIGVQSSTSLGDIQVNIPNGTVVTGPSTWDGKINLPQVVDKSSVTVKPDSGYRASVSAAIEIGCGDAALTLSKPVRILLPGQGGKKAGWVRSGIFHKIANVMTSDSAAALGASNDDGYLTVGNDLAIWTKHFTTFVAYTETAVSSDGGGRPALLTPSVQTVNVSAVTANSAVLNGNITSNNGYAISDYGFLWGTSSGSLTNKLQVGTDNHSGAFTATLSNLSPGTTYYFQAYATNSQGKADGSVLSFTTTGSTQAPTPITPTAPVFSDVPATYWGYEAISGLSGKKVVSGYPDGTFKPDNNITRAEFATMLVKALSLSAGGTTGKFADVKAGDWYYDTVNAAASAGLVSGIGNNLFAPNALITREQMAVMVARALRDKAPATDGTELNAFSDKSAVSSWAVSGLAEAVKAGIVKGMTVDTLAPKANATRAQAAVMIHKLLTILGK